MHKIGWVKINNGNKMDDVINIFDADLERGTIGINGTIIGHSPNIELTYCCTGIYKIFKSW